MTVLEHIKHTRRTWRIQGLKIDLEHAIEGIWSDGGEIASAFKRVIGYGKALDRINVMEECGDTLFYICRIQDQKELEVLDDVVVAKMFSTIDKEKSDYEVLALFFKSAGKIADYCDVSANKTYITTELHYMTYIIHHILTRIDYTIGDCRARNVAKLQARYPDKWTSDAASIRNLTAERNALEG